MRPAPEGLRIELIAQIKQRIPDTFLVLHGSSSIPAAAVTTINDNGGSVRSSSGISSEQKERGIGGGIRKINQGTDSHLAWTAGAREFATDNPADVEPSTAVASGIAAMTDIVEQRMHEFCSAGRLG